MATAVTPHPIYLAGRWVDSPDVLEVLNPAGSGEVTGATYNATPEQYEEAVRAAVTCSTCKAKSRQGVLMFKLFT